MNSIVRSLIAVVVLLACAPIRGHAQTAADGPVLAARRVTPTLAYKIWNPAGHLRLVAWDRDSIVVRGRVFDRNRFMFSGDSTAMKLGINPEFSSKPAGRSDLVIYLPRRGRGSVKTVSADIDGTGVSGWFYTVSGAMHLTGNASSVEAESMTGNLDLDVVAPWVHARTGDGHLLIRGQPQDVDAGTIAGTLDIAAATALRGQFSSVSGDIHYVGAPPLGGIFEFSNHSGNVDLVLPSNTSGTFALSSVVGSIENGFSAVRPVQSPARALRVTLGRGGASVTVRTFKGTIRLRPE
jgi:hypothetical protein